MKAIWQGQEYYIIEDDGDGVLLEPATGTEDNRFYVSYSDPTLIIDPTDGELDAAAAWRERMPSRGQTDNS